MRVQEIGLAGDGTSYETQIAKNSADIRALEQDIYRIDIELELLNYTQRWQMLTDDIFMRVAIDRRGSISS